jgi:uncharacterized phage protein (TIGR01671 family)
MSELLDGSMVNPGVLLDFLAHDGKGYDDEETEFMQYTGLKDKNGDEVYEGDIIMAKLQYQWSKTPIEKQMRRKLIVSYQPSRAQWQLWLLNDYKYFIRSHKGAISSLDEVDNIEVIGNIYENPELIKEKE